MIVLREINADNYKECCNLDAGDQGKFVASNKFSLAEAWVFPQWARPFAIYNDDEMIGFTMLSTEEALDGIIYLWRFMIDKKHQGKGYGKAAMLLIIDHVKRLYTQKKFTTSIEPENKVAGNLYKSVGFGFTGDVVDDELVMLLKL